MADDLAFVHGQLATRPGIDGTRTGVIGMMWGAGVLWGMRTRRVDAIAVLDGPTASDLPALREFDPGELRAGILDLRRTVRRPAVPVLDALVHAPRHIIAIDGLEHPHFFDFERLAHPDSAAAAHPEYHAIARYTLRFLDRYLKHDTSAEDDLASSPQALGLTGVTGTASRVAATPPPPRASDLLAWMRYGRADHALRRVRESLERDPPAKPLDPAAAFTVA